MLFIETALHGAYLIDLEPRADSRGFFARAWCRREFEQHGLATDFVQANIAFTKQRGTIRGLHYQVAPYGEAKLTRCTRGSVFEAIVDLRPDSPTYRRWLGVGLTAASYRMLYVPAGCARGYQTLEDDVEITYQVSQFYEPGAERGLRYDDPAFGIAWPLPATVISEKDLGWPPFAGEHP